MHSIHDGLPQFLIERIGFIVEIMYNSRLYNNFVNFFGKTFGKMGCKRVWFLSLPFWDTNVNIVSKIYTVSEYFYCVQNKLSCTLWKIKGCSKIRLSLQGMQHQWWIHSCCLYGIISCWHSTLVSRYCRQKWQERKCCKLVRQQDKAGRTSNHLILSIQVNIQTLYLHQEDVASQR